MTYADVKIKYGQYIPADPEDDKTYNATLHTFFRDYAHANRALAAISNEITGKLHPLNEGSSSLSGAPRYHVTHEGSLSGIQIKEYLSTIVQRGGEIYEVFL